MDSRQNLQDSLYKLSKATTVRENAACIDHVKGTAENMKNMDCIYIYLMFPDSPFLSKTERRWNRNVQRWRTRTFLSGKMGGMSSNSCYVTVGEKTS
jgi:hypothetical protein